MIRRDAHTNAEVLHLFPMRARDAGLMCCEECGLPVLSGMGHWTDDPDFYYEFRNHRIRCWQTAKTLPDFDWAVPELSLERRDTVRMKP